MQRELRDLLRGLDFELPQLHCQLQHDQQHLCLLRRLLHDQHWPMRFLQHLLSYLLWIYQLSMSHLSNWSHPSIQRNLRLQCWSHLQLKQRPVLQPRMQRRLCHLLQQSCNILPHLLEQRYSPILRHMCLQCWLFDERKRTVHSPNLLQHLSDLLHNFIDRMHSLQIKCNSPEQWNMCLCRRILHGCQRKLWPLLWIMPNL